MNRELTREEAIRLHKKMWKDMQDALGDNPDEEHRLEFKRNWVEEHFPNERVFLNCFLCEYVVGSNTGLSGRCVSCPIAWNSSVSPKCVSGLMAVVKDNKVDYRYSPISVILALPEREVQNDA